MAEAHERREALQLAHRSESLDAAAIAFAVVYVGDQIAALREAADAPTRALPSTSTARVALVAGLLRAFKDSPHEDDLRNVLNEWLVLKEGDAGVSAGD